MGKVIGIDFGTANSVVSVIMDGKPVVIPNAEGTRITPSIISFTKDGQCLVGQAAKRQAVGNPDGTFLSIKHFMGKTPAVFIGGKSFTPQELAAMIFQKLKADAEKFLGAPVTQAVIAVPAAFTNKQRKTIEEAASIAGLEILRILNDSTAAALAYGLDKDVEETILVFDFGARNCDVSILRLDEKVFEVLAVNGDANLGGENFDKKIVDAMIYEFRIMNGIDLANDKMSIARLFEAAENLKIELSTMNSANVNLPFIAVDDAGAKNLERMLTREEFNGLTQSLIRRASMPIITALEDAGLTSKDIDKIILVGGSTRIPAVQNMIRETFGKEPVKSLNPDECVSIGAAIQGGVLSGEFGKGNQILLLDVTPLSLGIETSCGLYTKVIERNTTIPTQKSQIFSTLTESQSKVEIHVLQGENEFAEDNKSLGRFVIHDIVHATEGGTTQIEIIFDIDQNGIVNVFARDKGGHIQRITVNA